MIAITSLILWISLAALLRQCFLAIHCAFTGPLSKIPGPLSYKLSPLPWAISNLTGNSMNIIPLLFKKYGDVVRVGPRDIIIAEKDAVYKVLVEEDLVKAPVYEAVQPVTKITNLITERNKAAYKIKRRHISPGFSTSYLNGLEPLMLDCILVLERFLQQECEKGNGSAVVDISRILGNLTSDVMSATSFGGSLNLVASDDQTLKGLFLERLKRFALEAQFPIIKYLPFVGKSKSELRMNSMIQEIISKRQAEKGQAKKDLLQVFVDTNRANPVSFSEAHIHEEMTLFMIAGSDTTSMTATCALVLLLNNQVALEKLIKEIDLVFPSVDDQITFSKTQDLHYLNAVISESMRLMPIVTNGLPRYTTEMTVISGYEIPSGTIVSPCISALMKDPRGWPDPEDFIPERWLGKYKGAEVDKKYFMPFSAGSRSCIGQQFALKELRLILASLVKRYSLRLIPGQSHKMKVHSVPWFTQGYYNIGVQPREN